MKKLLLSLCAITLQSMLFAQVPNSGFENWTGGNPTDWNSNNLQGIATPVTQSNDQHGGASALRMEVVSAFGNPYPALVSCTGTGGTGFPISQNFGSMSFYYKANLQGTDELATSVVLYDASNTGTAAGGFTTTANASVYTQMVVPITTIVAGNAASATITFTIGNSGSGGTVGTWMLIDDVALSMSTGTPELNPQNISLSAPQPNPASDYALLPFSLNTTSQADIRVYDLQGRLVEVILQETLSAGNYKAEINTTNLQSGIYTCVLSAGNEQHQVKLMVR